jgi:DNA-binding beta-propeller fold protein YncE
MRAMLASSPCPDPASRRGRPRRSARRLQALLAAAAACFAVLPTTAAADSAPDATWQVVAGTGGKAFGGDGMAATEARLNYPKAVATGPDGAVYIADTLNGRIRKVAKGIITTVAGNGTRSFSGDGGPRGRSRPQPAALDRRRGRRALYIADTDNQRIRRVAVDGTITTVAGNGRWGFGGDGGPAVAAALAGPQGIAVRPDGTLVIADTRNERIREISPDGVIRTVAGFGRAGYTGTAAPPARPCSAIHGP